MKHENLSIVISIVAIIISIISLSYAIFSNTKRENVEVWCSSNLPKSSITGEIKGEIIEVSEATKNQRANILVKKNDGTGNIIVYHNSNIEYKVGQKVRIEHDGVNDSNPQQTAAVCIEIIKDNPVNIGEKSKYVESDNLVNLRVKEESLTDSRVTLILENHTDKTYIYGAGYSIEYEKDGIWYEMIPINDMAFISIGYILKPNELKEITVDWEYHYGKLTSGKYRIIKGVFLEIDTPIREEEITHIAAELIIK
jgi:hypothetical protein